MPNSKNLPEFGNKMRANLKVINLVGKELIYLERSKPSDKYTRR